MFLSIQIDWIILKTYDQQFTLTTKNRCISSLRYVQTPNIYSVEMNLTTYAAVHGCNHSARQRLHNGAQCTQCGTVETASRTSQVSGLVSFLNSSSPRPVGSRVRGDKTYKGIVRIHQSSVAWMGRIW